VRAVLCGYYGMGNAGDEALLASLLQMLPQSVKPIVLSGNPSDTRKRYGVEVCPRKSLRVLQALRSADAFIWGGGSLMQDATSWLNPVYYGGLMGLAQGMGLKTIAWAQGVGPLQRNLTQVLAERSFGRCDGISVRDGQSAKLVHRWHFPFVQAPDPVWALDARRSDRLRGLPQPRVGVVLRSHPDLNLARLQRLIYGLQELQRQTQAFIVIIPFQPQTDTAIAEQIHVALPKISQIVTSDDPRELKGLFSELDLTISMRLHGLIMAAAEGSRCWAISYDPKVKVLMSELDLPGWDVTQIPQDIGTIAAQWTHHLTQGQGLSADQRYSLADRALMHRDVLRVALGFDDPV